MTIFRSKLRSGFRGRWKVRAALAPAAALLAVFALAGPASAGVGGNPLFPAQVVEPWANQCLDVQNETLVPGQPVDIWPCDGKFNQLWYYNSQDHLLEMGPSGAPWFFCLDVQGAGKANTTSVQIWPCNGSDPAQIWYPEPDGALWNPNSYKCLDVPSWNSSPGTKLEIYGCTGWANQEWNSPGNWSW